MICLSHATGSGGDDVARMVAERLGFLHVDEEIVARAAARGGIPPADVADEERRRSLAARILGSLSEGGGGALALGGAVPFMLEDEPNADDIRALIREAIEQTAARGKVVITAHAASHALRPASSILRVLVTASPETRTKRVSEQGGIDITKAARTVKTADAARRDYLKRFYDVADELPTHYDLVVNTDKISADQAGELIAAVATTASR